MSILKNTFCFAALFALLAVAIGQSAQGGPHTSQGGPHQNQGRAKRQVDQVESQAIVNWTSCDPTVTPKYSCQDCNTRLVCLPIGGKTISCPIVFAPYCNEGFCSPIPSADCQ
ncbi:uncharacterized protein LOC125231259 [Leguminivora glycinivorella]|uniref:uncharacterized protein LOC125231259 n=1 Tax=Leguminivora glycinivorella TaxID=1035111 RepID=UPI0020109E58|nr:uncharacterized protein LOC125231259 [Leguminivora glycinivorella]